MKKILSSLAILATVFGMTTSIVMAKSFTDVKNTKYEEAVDVLSELKVIDGYGDNTYKPNNSVKRSEMAKLIIVAMGKDSSAESLKGNTNFSDVSSSHWASGYINLASSLGLIKGYPDGTFRPDATVSYVEASTMLLRALDYGKELDNLSWPNGYMTKANSAGLLENVTANNSSETAIRGNIASMILNTLKANTRKVVASNSTGNIYGDSTVLIEKAFSDLIYVKKGLITDIDVDALELTIKDETSNRTLKVTYEDTTEIKKLFGRNVTFIYDKDIEEFLSFKIIDKQTVKTVNVYVIDEEEGIFIDTNDKEYDLPKSSKILYIGTSKHEDIEKAYVTLDEKGTVSYIVFEGTEQIYAGIVLDNSIKVNNVSGIEILNVKNEYEELPLSSTSTKIYIDDIILYSYNNEDKIIIKDLVDVNDAVSIDSISSSSIKLKGEDKLTFTSKTQYQVFLIDVMSIESVTLSDIDATYDLATTAKIGDVWYIIAFDDSVDPEDIATGVSVSDAKRALNTALQNGKKKKESSYSVVTYERLKAAIEYGDRIYSASSAYSSAMIQLATKEINDAIAELKSVTSADRTLRADFSNLQETIKEVEALDESDYTPASWKVLKSALEVAKKIVIDKTTSPKVTEADNNLKSAKNYLVTNVSAQQVKDALARLDRAIEKAKNIKSGTYETSSYNHLVKQLNSAKNIDRTNSGAGEIKNVAINLEAAIEALIPIKMATYNTEKSKLDSNFKKALATKEEEYTAKSWTEFTKLFNPIKTKYLSLKKYEDVKAMTNENIQKEIYDVIKPLNDEITNALNKLVLQKDEILRDNIVSIINVYTNKVKNDYNTEQKWKNTGSKLTFKALNDKIAEAEQAIANNAGTAELKEIAEYLQLYIPLGTTSNN